MELDNDAIEDFEPMPSERRWRGRERNEETMNAMQRCCEMEGEESRQCMLETRKLKNNILCDKMTEEMKDTSTMPAWKQEFMTSRLGCCEKTGEERHQCFSDIPNRRQMKPNPRQFWQDPENRFNEEHRDRICERIVEDEDVSQIERELDEDVATDNEKLSIGMMLKNFNKMLTFFYQKMTKDNDLMDKMTECCFVDDDDEARACFEDSRKMRIDNMCEMVNENSEAEDDDDVMSRPSFWVQEKTRCCAMEGEGRYTCIDELRQRGMGRPGMDGQPGLSRPGRWWGQGRPQMSRPYFPEMGSKTGEEYRIPSGMDKPKWEMGKPGRQGRPGRRQQMKEEKLDSSQEFGRRRGPPTRGEIDPKKVDDFCDTPVARTAILMGMPKRPGFPPALCCQQDEDNMEERYRCFRERLREIRLAPEFDFTPDQPQTEDIGKTYWSSNEKPVQKPERDENPMVDIYESAESREDEDDNGEEHSCCRVGRAVGTKIDDFRFIRCEAKSIQLSKKRQSSRACRRAFVRCCVGRRDRNEE
ncbi:uncharacterized protein [Ptychodera flava]|uniref:uncharacterized protein n=1 Tax=Ptychodera flava TaxID=63121 RepID=UPI00396A31F5